MAIRTREREQSDISHYYRTTVRSDGSISTTDYGSKSLPLSHESTTDDAEGDYFQSFTSTKRYFGKSTVPMSGSRTIGNNTYHSDNHYPDIVRISSSICNPRPSFSSAPSDGVLFTELLAKTNPSRPIIDLPLFIYELRELPDLIRHNGQSLLKHMAESNLRFHFGWVPLLSDLSSMINFAEESRKRFQELKALSESGIRRKRSLYTDSYTSSVNDVPLQSVNGNVRGDVITSMRVDKWGYVEWHPAKNFPTSDRELKRLAYKAQLGLTADFYLLWNAMPWSWLADWFLNVSDYLMATRNIIPCTFKNGVIMTRSYSESMTEVTGGTYPLNGRFQLIYDIKARRPVSAPVRQASINGLTARQLSILGSIGILNRRNKSYLATA